MKFDKRLIKMKKLFTLIAAASLMAACSDEVTTNRSEGDKQYISFSVSDTQNSSTRALVAPWNNEQTEVSDAEKCVVAVDTDLPTEYPLCLTISDEPFIHRTESDLTRGAILNSGDAASLEFGVTEFLKDGDTEYFSNTKPAYQNVTLDGGRELFKANEFWEYDSYDGIEYDFYAYAPHVNGSGQGITLSNHNRTITYDATGISVGSQPDLMTARKWTSSYVGAIPLNFQHRLCAIQIKTAGAWASGIHVSGVKFLNVISSGTFDIDTDKDDAWTSKGAAGDYVVSGFNEAAATATVVTGPTDKWLMMVPQTLSGAKLSITLTDGSSNSTILTAPINSTAWSAGHTVTYTISPEAITDITVNYPSGISRSWNNDGAAVSGPITTYETSDQFGLFVVDKDNKILISNQLVTPTAGDAAASRILDISFFKSKQYRYFLMYPYKDDAALEDLVGTTEYNSYYKEGATARSANADAFFEEVISNWSPVNDQSAEATFKSQDLQIAALSGDHFDMVHKMGLIAITMPLQTIRKTRYYQISGSTWVENDTKTTDANNVISASGSTNFTTSWKPWVNTTTTCFLINKPGSGAPTISANRGTSESTYSWSVDDLYITSAASYKTTTLPSLPSPTYLYNAWEFNYEGAGRSFEIPATGTYCIECWGASGGNATSYGTGAYTKGIISLDNNQILYIYVGQKGQNGYTSATPVTSFNGGGKGVRSSYSYSLSSGGGGGATDIRTKEGLTSSQASSWADVWNNAYGLRGRVMVAAGGGGPSGNSANGGYGGGLQGYGTPSNGGSSGSLGGCTGATQTTYGKTSQARISGSIAWTAGTNGAFGIGGNGGTSNNINCGAGGGGGYWAGAGGGSGNVGMAGISGSSGSSYISGHAGCVAIASPAGTTASTAGTANSVERATHYSGLVFTNTVMIDGAGYQWTTSKVTSVVVNVPQTDFYGTSNRETDSHGHIGNGFARITQILE